ncbi:hypothetical protein D3C78_623220 [compost metagenome]
MAGYQFIRVMPFARVGSRQERAATKKKPARVEVKWSASDIAAEADRQPGACNHVEAPRQPNYLLGGPVSAVVAEAEAWAATQRDPLGRKMRQDAPVMLAGVVTLPGDRLADWPSFRDDSITWLRAKYGDRLRCVVEHLDEAHPHIHFYAVPLPGESFDRLHEGRQAAAEAKAQGCLKGGQNAAYQAAMSGLQDVFWADVAQRHGLARIGPGRSRMTRSEWAAMQRAAEQVAELRRSADALPAVIEHRDELHAQVAKLRDLRRRDAEDLGVIKSLKAAAPEVYAEIVTLVEQQLAQQAAQDAARLRQADEPDQLPEPPMP